MSRLKVKHAAEDDLKNGQQITDGDICLEADRLFTNVKPVFLFFDPEFLPCPTSFQMGNIE